MSGTTTAGAGEAAGTPAHGADGPASAVRPP